MLTALMMDWTTVRSASSILTITADEPHWLDLTAFQDIVAFLDVKNIDLGTGGTTLSITYQTAPTKDNSLFVNVATGVTLATGLTITKMLKDSTTNPLSRWLRWQIAVSAGTPTLAWGTTLRVWIAANLSANRGSVPMAPDTRMRMLPGMPSTPMGMRRSANGG